MKALVTGYSSGIGKAICECLSQNGYEILTLKTRLQNSVELEKEVKELLKTNDINVLVNCAGRGVFQPHEEISVAKIKELVDVNLTAPLILSS
ncbi:MAG: SDR family oxidoreductase, partial [Arcobacteraceae bacterium]|nr:SDR family oxidoreductase [Arcobacteraceae bacterium]